MADGVGRGAVKTKVPVKVPLKGVGAEAKTTGEAQNAKRANASIEGTSFPNVPRNANLFHNNLLRIITILMGENRTVAKFSHRHGTLRAWAWPG